MTRISNDGKIGLDLNEAYSLYDLKKHRKKNGLEQIVPKDVLSKQSTKIGMNKSRQSFLQKQTGESVESDSQIKYHVFNEGEGDS